MPVFISPDIKHIERVSAISFTVEAHVVTGVCMKESMHSHFNQCFNGKQRAACVSFMALRLYTSGLFLQHLLTAAKHGIFFFTCVCSIKAIEHLL